MVFVRHALIVVGALVVGGTLAALAVVLSGAFNVGATVADSAPLRWLLVTTREASIGLHARDVAVPPDGPPGDIDRGFRIFRAQCAMCHTPVGREPDAMAVGFNPQAPTFGPDADDMDPAELFWVTKNGIRFTGMPAWGPSLTDAEIWDVVAFVAAMPDMTAADYDAFDARLPAAAPGP